MSVLNQKTIKQKIAFKGIGLHSGLNINLIIKPAEPNTGIIFIRTDLNKNNIIIPDIFNVSSASFCTTISNESGACISTIEHLMGALYGLGIDNVIIEIDNREVPILDGSAKLFVEAIKNVGIEVSNSPIKIIKIEKKIEFNDGKKSISIEPNRISLEIDFEIKYKNPFIGNQRNSVDIYRDDLTDIYNSRTFCVLEDVEKLKSIGLAKGGNLKNALVVGDGKVLNDDGLRNKNEFVNHKILDCMGDIYLSGYKIIGKIVCSQGGHKLTNQILRKVFSHKNNFSIVEIKEKNLPYTYINKNILKSIA
jgi:UDP-3-O-[3-hydroxymyristoyl] N-acetylglucosamine deacetylase